MGGSIFGKIEDDFRTIPRRSVDADITVHETKQMTPESPISQVI